MIQSYEDYKYYLEADRLSLGVERVKPRLFGFDILTFQILLRKLEYYYNCKGSTIYKPYIKVLELRYKILSLMLGIAISPNVFGPGLNIAHPYTIGVNASAKIGANCRIHPGLNIGSKAGHSDVAPTIGDNVYIGPGVKIFGDIHIANGIAIGANAVVNKSFDEENISIAGVPAKKINNKGSDGLIIRGTEILNEREQT